MFLVSVYEWTDSTHTRKSGYYRSFETKAQALDWIKVKALDGEEDVIKIKLYELIDEWTKIN